MDSELHRTPLFAEHQRLGAKLVPFAGWEMPVQYRGILEEHRAVRRRVGLFDVSHLCRFEVSGPAAAPFLDGLATGDIASLPVGRARYTLFCQEQGGILDDLMVVHSKEDVFLVVANAASATKDWWWLQTHARGLADLTLEDVTSKTVMLALQGPRAHTQLDHLFHKPLSGELRTLGCAMVTHRHTEVLVSRTGYTGEDGFEVVAPAEEGLHLWQLLLGRGVSPCGLGSRDTLRLEAGLHLYGSDMNEETDPYEAGLGWVVNLDKGDFVGKDALIKIKAQGVRRRLVGLEMVGRGVARAGYDILGAGQVVGRTTSGSYAPTLDKNIALGYVEVELSVPGAEVEVDIRGRLVAARVVALPFYRRPH